MGFHAKLAPPSDGEERKPKTPPPFTTGEEKLNAAAMVALAAAPVGATAFNQRKGVAVFVSVRQWLGRNANEPAALET